MHAPRTIIRLWVNQLLRNGYTQTYMIVKTKTKFFHTVCSNKKDDMVLKACGVLLYIRPLDLLVLKSTCI